ncbi:MAG: replication initiator protein A [Eubacteriales bacterium]|nr:replication initiator protein A [Eubacteriales bacterium]
MSKMEYQPVSCLLVPKALFQEERYRNLSTTAKLLYSLLLDRYDLAALNGWVDRQGRRYVIYPKSEQKRDLNCTRYRADTAVRELENGNMVWIVNGNGRPNRFYFKDITEKNVEDNAMMRMESLMDMVKPEDREIVQEKMDKLAISAREAMEELVKRGYFGTGKAEAQNNPGPTMEEDSEDEASCYDEDWAASELDPMEYRGYYDKNGDLDEDNIQSDAGELGMALAFQLYNAYSNNPDQMQDVQEHLNAAYNDYSKKTFMAVIAAVSAVLSVDWVWLEDMYACNKPARKIYLEEMMDIFNMYINMLTAKA